ncbi:MAG: nitroreductase family protein [Aggregatilineales bacterium]
MTASSTLDKSAKTDYDIHPFLANRWSPRAFADKAIPSAEIGSLLEAARWSASSGNSQPWSFIVATRDNADEYEKMLGVLKEGNQRWAASAPLLILAVAHDAHTRTISLFDLGLAVQNLTTEAQSRDLFVHQMGGIYPEKAHEIYNVPAEHKVVVALAVGYLGNPNDLPDDLRERELNERSRKPLASIAFESEWGKSVSTING